MPVFCIQGIDEIEFDFEKRPPTGKSRFTPTPVPRQGGKAGSAAAAPVSRRNLAARYASAAAAAAGAAVRSTKDSVTGLLRKVCCAVQPGEAAPKACTLA